MLRIRADQISVFERQSLQQFETDVLVHLQQSFPLVSNATGETSLRQTIRLGIARAGQYGFTNCGPVRFYIDLMLMFGSDFDTDPQTYWAAVVLNDASLCDQATKAEQLFTATLDWLARVAGPGNLYAEQALRNTLYLLSNGTAALESAVPLDILELLSAAHPEKVQQMGVGNVSALVTSGRALAARLGLPIERGAALCTLAMFGLGHGFPRDPSFLWLSEVLYDSYSNDRVTALQSKLVTHLKNAIAGLEAEKH